MCPGLRPATEADAPFLRALAVQQLNGQDGVFIRLSADHFVMRPIQAGDSAQGMVTVVSGIQPGDQVVTQGSFLVKSQLLRSSIGD